MLRRVEYENSFTVEPEIDSIKILMTNGSLMKVESNAFCNTFDPH